MTLRSLDDARCGDGSRLVDFQAYAEQVTGRALAGKATKMGEIDGGLFATGMGMPCSRREPGH